ncbi:MAG: proline--tRNA ligase [Mariprofundaceae bacterium]|nr:proline--tRNA ligase [Mariprofundaceae bacterium]
MLLSKYLAPTLRDTPADAEVISHQLLLRAGYIRRVSSGIYDLLPLGLKVLRNIETIVREELDQTGAQELLMPMVQPAELWQESQRWQKYGKELLRFKDRHNHEACLGPTHEEVVCDLVRRDLRSYRQLPLTVYQIQSKFRDEVRPRFGLMRGREFTMKDAYSFHADEDCLSNEYQNMFDAYTRIFSRLGLSFRAVEADTGSIGGDKSHEFHVLAQSGEDLIMHCSGCDYAANQEKAVSKKEISSTSNSQLPQDVSTPASKAVGDVAALLDYAESQIIKSMAYHVQGGEYDGQCVLACVRGDDQIQEIKLMRALGADEIQLADEAQVQSMGSVSGYIGPVGINAPVWMDQQLSTAQGMICGANQADTHRQHINVERDITEANFADLRNVQEGESCVHCGGEIESSRGIEVGHIFTLGDVYSQAMQVGFLNKQGRRAITTMGCYGIGISRLVAAVVEQCHDDDGICWPKQIAPFHVSLITLGQSETVRTASKEVYDQLQEAGISVLWDERKERPGVKFCDAELMGFPVQIIVGDRGLKEGHVEFKARRDEEKTSVTLSNIITHTQQHLAL